MGDCDIISTHMLKEISRGSFKFFLSGHGMSVKTGKYVALAALVGTLV